jgi:hypothetical protein
VRAKIYLLSFRIVRTLTLGHYKLLLIATLSLARWSCKLHYGEATEESWGIVEGEWIVEKSMDGWGIVERIVRGDNDDCGWIGN